MNLKTIIASLAILSCAFVSSAQMRGPVVSQIVHPDNTVTFSLVVHEAENVKIIARFAPKTVHRKGHRAPDNAPWRWNIHE